MKKRFKRRTALFLSIATATMMLTAGSGAWANEETAATPSALSTGTDSPATPAAAPPMPDNPEATPQPTEGVGSETALQPTEGADAKGTSEPAETVSGETTPAPTEGADAEGTSEPTETASDETTPEPTEGAGAETTSEPTAAPSATAEQTPSPENAPAAFSQPRDADSDKEWTYHLKLIYRNAQTEPCFNDGIPRYATLKSMDGTKQWKIWDDRYTDVTLTNGMYLMTDYYIGDDDERNIMPEAREMEFEDGDFRILDLDDENGDYVTFCVWVLRLFPEIDIDPDIQHGSVTTQRYFGDPGETLYVTVTPDPGYELESFWIEKVAGYGEFTYSPTDTGYAIVLPDGDGMIHATFRKKAAEYIITIPTSVNLNDGEGLTVSATEIKNLGTEERISVTMQSQNQWTLQSGANSIPYQSSLSDNRISFQNDGNQTIQFTIDAEDETPIGEYSDTLTFTVEVSSFSAGE